jgi:hypothetical protein
MWVWGAALVCALLATPARADGPGIKLGDRLLLHLGLGAEFRYDDNVLYACGCTISGMSFPKIDGFSFRLIPSLDLATRTARDGTGSTVDFVLHAGMTYNEFISNRDTLASHRDYGVDFGARMTLFPHGRYQLALFDNFTRTTQLPYQLEPFNFDRDTNQLGIRGTAAPGGGRLRIDLGYTFGVDYFEQRQFQGSNAYSHLLTLRLAWNFFPKTALYLAADETIYRYFGPQDPSNPHTDAYPFHIELGVQGLITPKLTVNAWIGYGNGFYVSNALVANVGSPNTAVGGVNVTWKPTLLSTGSIGYRYDFMNSVIGSYHNAHQAFISWTQLIWRFTGFARLQYSNFDYHDLPLGSGVVDANGKPITERVDNSILFELRVDYPFKPYLIASLGYDLQYNQTDSKLQVMPGSPLLLPLNYLKNEVYLRLSVLY